jgi:type IV pilus assembly protein PilA
MFDKLRNRIARDEKGFTLIELLVVVIILGILTAIAVPSYLSFRGKAQDSAAQANVRSAVPAVEGFYSNNDTYVGMDNATTGLSTVDQSLNVANYTISNLSTSTYCIQYPAGAVGSHTWYKNGPSAPIAQADATHHC